jgi:conjugal transfer pilus assembly protein TraL
MATETRIPRRLDDVWKLGFIDLDVALPFVVIFLFAALADSFQFGWKTLLGVFMGVWASRWYSRRRADKHPAFMLHLAYWFLPSIFSPLKRTPPSHFRRMIG